jgi:carboxylate-amine ligase
MSYRTKLFEALPLAGIYSHIESWAGLVEEVETLIKSRVIGSFQDLWWDTRPNPKYGTIEVRICDLPIRFDDILGITALIQGLCAHLAENPEKTMPLNGYLLKANKWQAVRYGLRGWYVDPSGHQKLDRIRYLDLIPRLVTMIEPQAAKLGIASALGYLNTILFRGTGSDFMRQQFSTTSDLKEVIQSLQETFWQ